MDFNPLLIKKYIEGTCTPVEKELVELWLDDIEVPEMDLYAEEFSQAEGRMWESIRQELPSKSKSIFKINIPFLRYSVAASLGGILVLTGYLIFQQKLNNLNNPELIGPGSLTYKASPFGSIYEVSEVSPERNKLVFEGEILINNKTASGKEVQLISGRSATSTNTQIVTIQQGKKYAALNHQAGTDELIVCDLEGYLHDLPPAVYHKVQQIRKFNL
ncbi:hypothetical protein [Arthrospiribacter ruber]|uniref:Uncharacterized protein n=1 Tax=Arthrospiribacter ruber TaxID=2487934 RepID=A0A951MGQ7_9BACT|nr:hypothetical protein [Arthrospiribacter ruber]MBW3469570.1 hypothetical protein [Arthrospiribacter ruber]